MKQPVGLLPCIAAPAKCLPQRMPPLRRHASIATVSRPCILKRQTFVVQMVYRADTRMPLQLRVATPRKVRGDEQEQNITIRYTL